MRHTKAALSLAKRFAYAAVALVNRIALSASQESAAAHEMDQVGMRITEAAEACRLTAYRDAVGALTIGWGHTGRDVYEGMCITQAQADLLLRHDLICVEMCVNSAVHVALTQNQFDALTDLTFNIGAGAFLSSTLLHQLNLGNYAAAAAEFAKWNHAGGRILPGLTARREAERELFLRPDAPISLSASGGDDLSLRLLIQRTIVEDIEDLGPIYNALREAIDA